VNTKNDLLDEISIYPESQAMLKLRWNIMNESREISKFYEILLKTKNDLIDEISVYPESQGMLELSHLIS
jgi:hypothetical protein